MGAAAAAENRPGRADHHAAAWQDIKELADLVGASADVVDDDGGSQLAQQLGTLPGRQLDRTVRLVQRGDQAMEEIFHTVLVCPQEDTIRSAVSLGGARGDVLKKRRLAVTACRMEPDMMSAPDGV